MKRAKMLPARSDVPETDRWDLSNLYPDDAAWEAQFTAWERKILRYARFQGKLGEGPKSLAACFRFHLDLERTGERLGNYAFLKTSEDTTNSDYQRMLGRFSNAASRAGQAAAFIQPEILALGDDRLQDYLDSKPLAPYRLMLQRIVRQRPHTLGPNEERLLAMQSEMADTAGQVFRQLNDADLKFGTIEDHQGVRVELTHGTFVRLLHAPDRAVRAAAFKQYYQAFADHQHTLSAALEGSIQRDVYYARARNHASALEMALFPDNVPLAVYDNLIGAVHRHLPDLHRYYELRRRKMKLRSIHQYDTYVPILAEMEARHTWDEAVEAVLAALKPLGDDYVSALAGGLRGRWCDRYENRGKRSGAFSSGAFDGDPYILMNFQPDVLDHVFTLAHEAGHSMHSYYSARRQPFAYYNYTIFVAEVASTFNEQLLSRHLLQRATDDRQRAYLINREIDDIRATLFRQTMFAEFEKLAHQRVEANEPLTVEAFKQIYRGLLEQYFGPKFALDDELALECLRIPHFYRAFYVYKYATGMSAAIALAQRVVEGGPDELRQYREFLAAGCSQDPLDLLRAAGVDMEQPAPVETALAHFARRVDELEQLL